MSALVPWRWDGDEGTLRPLTNRDLGLEHGAVYRLDPVEERSVKSHRHFFATVVDYWQTLPERLMTMPWASCPDHMRDHALLSTGWHTVETYPCASRAEAMRWMTLLPPLVRLEGQKSRIVYTQKFVEGSTLCRAVPRSQAYRAMGREDFQASKDAVLAFLAELVGAEVTA